METDGSCLIGGTGAGGWIEGYYGHRITFLKMMEIQVPSFLTKLLNFTFCKSVDATSLSSHVRPSEKIQLDGEIIG